MQGDATDIKIIISGMDCDLIEPVASDFMDNLSNDLALGYFSVINVSVNSKLTLEVGEVSLLFYQDHDQGPYLPSMSLLMNFLRVRDSDYFQNYFPVCHNKLGGSC